MDASFSIAHTTTPACWSGLRIGFGNRLLNVLFILLCIPTTLRPSAPWTQNPAMLHGAFSIAPALVEMRGTESCLPGVCISVRIAEKRYVNSDDIGAFEFVFASVAADFVAAGNDPRTCLSLLVSA